MCAYLDMYFPYKKFWLLVFQVTKENLWSFTYKMWKSRCCREPGWCWTVYWGMGGGMGDNMLSARVLFSKENYFTGEGDGTTDMQSSTHFGPGCFKNT